MPTPSLVVRLLGPPEATIEGAPLRVDTRKALAVLAYLIATEQPQARQHLAALLWPEADDASARGALRRTLSTLKAALGDRHLVIARDSVVLDRAAVAADVWQVREAIGRRRPIPAAVEAARRGEFMAGFALRDAPDFEDWVLAEAEAWRQRCMAVLVAAGGRASAEGDLPAAIDLAARRLELDRLDEAAHRDLMALYARTGDRAAAIRQYRSCVRLLSDELDVEPLPETVALHDAILSGAPMDEPAGPPRQEMAGPPTLPFVGRDADLARLTDALQSGDPRLVLIEGEPGIGKTRLVSELLAFAERDGRQSAVLRGYPGRESTPYAALVDLVEREREAAIELDLDTATELDRLVPRERPRAAVADSLDGPGAEARFVEALATALVGLAGDLLVVDDAQWVDARTLAVVARAARRTEGGRPLIVICRRYVEAVADHLLPELADARRAGRLLDLPLARLEADDVRRLVTAVLPNSDAASLYAESGGVPFYLAERIAATLAGMDETEIPAGVRDLVRTRVAAVGPTARQLLAAAAVLGRAFDPDLARAASGRTADETADAIDELEGHRLVVGRHGQLEIDHELTRSVVLDDLGGGRRRLLNRRAAEALILRGARTRAPGDVARHFEQAGEHAAAAAWHVMAAERASGLYAHADAIRHWEAALGLSPEPDPWWHQRIAQAFMLLGRYADALRAFDAAAAALPPDEVWCAELGTARAHRLVGNLELAEAHLASALEADPTAAPRAAIEIERARIAKRLGRLEDAAAHAAAALDAARGGDALELAEAHNVSALVARHRGDLPSARAHLTDALAIVAAMARPSVRMAALNNLALVEASEGSSASAEARLRQALSLATTLNDRHHEAALRNNLADVLNSAGRRDEAIAEVARSATILADLGRLATGAEEPSAEVWRLVDW